jgi:hypothetical protein
LIEGVIALSQPRLLILQAMDNLSLSQSPLPSNPRLTPRLNVSLLLISFYQAKRQQLPDLKEDRVNGLLLLLRPLVPTPKNQDLEL